jgi:DNA-binding SARP family transcriptional activator
MSFLEVRVLGPPAVLLEGRPLHITRRQTRALLYRLAAQAGPVPREHLCFLFWSNHTESEARRNLSHLLTHLRHSLPDPHLLDVDSDHVGLDQNRIRSDAMEFVAECDLYQRIPQVGQLYILDKLYRGPFLSGFSLPGSPEFELWAIARRTVFERMHLEVLAILVEEHIRLGELGNAIQYANNYLEINSFDEAMHRRLIELYGAISDRRAAMEQYQLCADVLRRDLGISPGAATQTAYRNVLADLLSPSALQAEVDERLKQIRHHQPGYHCANLYPLSALRRS